MITYDPRTWFRFILTFHKEDTFRKLLPMILAISVYTFAVACIEFLWWKLSGNTYLKNLYLLHNLLGFVLSLLLVFRTNSAYERWWEGSILWNDLTSTSRNLSMKMHAILSADDTGNRLFFKQSIPLFVYKLRDELGTLQKFSPIDMAHPHPELLEHTTINDPAGILSLMYNRIFELQAQGKINGEQVLIVYTDIEKLNNIYGACYRIKTTPIPSSYSIFVKKFIYVYIMTLPFGFVLSLGFWVIPVVAFVYYVLASLEMIAEEIEDPFGDDANDIPTDTIAAAIKQSVENIIK